MIHFCYFFLILSSIPALFTFYYDRIYGSRVWRCLILTLNNYSKISYIPNQVNNKKRVTLLSLIRLNWIILIHSPNRSTLRICLSMLKIKIDHKIHTHTLQHSLYLPLLHCSVDVVLLPLIFSAPQRWYPTIKSYMQYNKPTRHVVKVYGVATLCQPLLLSDTDVILHCT